MGNGGHPQRISGHGGMSKVRGRSASFSADVIVPMDERQEGEHFWVYLGSSQAAKFNLKCVECGKLVDLDDVMG